MSRTSDPLADFNLWAASIPRRHGLVFSRAHPAKMVEDRAILRMVRRDIGAARRPQYRLVSPRGAAGQWFHLVPSSRPTLACRCSVPMTSSDLAEGIADAKKPARTPTPTARAKNLRKITHYRLPPAPGSSSDPVRAEPPAHPRCSSGEGSAGVREGDGTARVSRPSPASPGSVRSGRRQVSSARRRCGLAPGGE